jgi:cytochrome c553
MWAMRKSNVMRRDRKRLPGRWLGITSTAAVALLTGVLLLSWSGLYNVAASRGHWPPIRWFLEFSMHSSVRTQAMRIEAPRTYDDDQAILGAGHFHAGCASCHGAPGWPIAEAARRMLPPPPDLATKVPLWRDRELFWIVKNGIKYTGMPAWVAQTRDDEVWAIVAFLKRYPSLDAQNYRRLVFGPLPTAPQSGNDIAATGAPAADATGACARCHGAGNQGPASKLVPTLHGQPRQFLATALAQFARGTRPSGIMQPIAADLEPNDIDKVAAYYAALKPPTEAMENANGVTRGRALAEGGDHAARVPPCASCHGAEALPVYPRLAGQNAPYFRMRLRLWKQGRGANSATAAIMAPIARVLTDEQIEDVATYYASQKPGSSSQK